MGPIKPTYTTSSMMGVENDETVTFRDGTEQWMTTIRAHLDETRLVASTNQMQLKDYMARPLKVASYTWDPASVTPFFQQFDPWSLFFNSANVANRIATFNLMSCKLHVKFMINGNSFYYGRLMADYSIRPGEDFVSSSSGAILANVIQASQRLHLFIDPCLSQAGVMTLPMLTPANVLSIPNTAWLQQGTINIRQMQSLKHANGSTEPITISVFVHATDMLLSQPTTAIGGTLAPQAGDEYGNGPISGVMSSIAKASGMLATIPWITPYAKATQMVAGKLGKMASLFGYSRPVIIEDTTPVRRYVLGNLANTDRRDPCTKLTVDSKQELSVDPAIVGVDVEDELVIKHIASVESYVTQFNMPTTAAAGAVLWNARVSPVHPVFVDTYVYNPACTFAVTPFKYWRGKMKYRFQIVASAYHKGRLLISYDPNFSSKLNTNLQYSKIVDLADERDFTIEVCWTQPVSFLAVPSLLTNSNFQVAPYAVESGSHNGVITVSVMNELTTPNSSVNNDIAINVFVSAGDDFQVAVPVDVYKGYSYLRPVGVLPQAGDVEGMSDTGPEENAPISMDTKECVGEPLKLDNTLDVFFGEEISSFRQLLKRYTLHSVYPLFGVDNSLTNISEFDFPVYRGFGPDARHVVTGPVNANIVNTTLINYLTPAFYAYRGGMRSKYLLVNGGTSPSMLKVTRNEGPSLAYAVGTIVPTNTNAATFSSTYLSPIPDGSLGCEETVTSIQPSVEVEFPFYSPQRFFLARGFSRTSNNGFNRLRHIISVLLSPYGTSRPYLERHVAVAEDFSLTLFQGQPPFLPSVTLTPV